MSQLFRANFTKFVKDIKSSLEKDVRNGDIDKCHKNLSKKFKPNEISGVLNGLYQQELEEQNLPQKREKVWHRCYKD